MSRILVAGIEGIDPTKFRKPDEPTSNDMSFLNKPNGCLWVQHYCMMIYINRIG